MNNKISSGEVMVIIIASIFSLFPDFLILSLAKNASLISLLIGFLIGFIPIFMLIYISKKIDTNFFSFLKNKFKNFSYPIIITLMLIAIFIIFTSAWLHFNFIISQFLIRDSYYFIAILIALAIIFALNKGLEAFSRTSFILFLIAISILLLLLTSLIPYVDLSNLKPYLNASLPNILNSALMFVVLSTLPLVYILELKNNTHDKSNFSRKILMGYLIGFLLIILMLFFILTVYGIDLATMFTYPFYALFKKVQVFGFIERIENFAAIIFITSFFVEITFMFYFIKKNITNIFKVTSKKLNLILTIALPILLFFISIYLFKDLNLAKYLNYVHYIVGILFIIIIIIFLRCLLIKKT